MTEDTDRGKDQDLKKDAAERVQAIPVAHRRIVGKVADKWVMLILKC